MQDVRQDHREPGLLLVPAAASLLAGVGLMGIDLAILAIPAFLLASVFAFRSIWRLFRRGRRPPTWRPG